VGMSRKHDDDFEKLMAETERALGAVGGGGPAARRQEPAPPRTPGKLETSLRTSAVSGAVAAAMVAILFAATPFMDTVSGAAGAFVATFVIMLVQRITGSRRN
jgi:hypothetical protein